MWVVDGVKDGWVLGALSTWVVDVWTVRQLVKCVNDCFVLESAMVGGLGDENDAITTSRSSTGLVLFLSCTGITGLTSLLVVFSSFVVGDSPGSPLPLSKPLTLF